MQTSFLFFLFLATVLPFLRISPFLNRTWLVTMAAIVLLHAAVIAFYAVYIQSIGSGMNFFSELSNEFLLEFFTSQLLASSLLPVAPTGDNEPKQKVNLPAFAANAVKVFSNPLLERREISFFLKGKTGIYMFFNKVNGKFYIGSGVNMSQRVNYYFQNCYFKHNPNSIIGKAILKYGMENFCLVILEFCNKEELLSRETHFISASNSAYNILKEAGNLSGYKHKLESILKIGKASLGRRHLPEIRARISETQKIRLKNFRPLGFAVSVLDLVNNNTTEYLSIAQAAKELGLNPSSVSKRMNKGITSAFKGRYVITVKGS